MAPTLIVAVSAALLLFSSGSASAATIAIGYYTSPGDSTTYTALYLNSASDGNYVSGEANPDKEMYGSSATIDDWSGTYSNSYLHVNYDIHLDNDPQVTSFFALQNTSGFINTYTMTVTQPLGSYPSSIGSGSTGYTLTSSFPNAMLDAPPLSALYNAQINGATVMPLFPAGSASLPVVTSTSAVISDSFSGQSEGPANSIGIFNNFTLTPGDLASSTSIFTIDATLVPEPASITLSLLGLASVMLALRPLRR